MLQYIKCAVIVIEFPKFSRGNLIRSAKSFSSYFQNVFLQIQQVFFIQRSNKFVRQTEFYSLYTPLSILVIIFYCKYHEHFKRISFMNKISDISGEAIVHAH